MERYLFYDNCVIFFSRSGCRGFSVSISEDAVSNADPLFRVNAPFFQKSLTLFAFKHLIRSVDPARAETGGISSRTLRGKNTTRHTQLFDCGSYRIFDTPGFTAFDVEGIKPEELASFFPEMARPGGECRFRDCMHLDEPGCAVKEALAAGKIAKSRYNSYKEIFAELKKQSEY